MSADRGVNPEGCISPALLTGHGHHVPAMHHDRNKEHNQDSKAPMASGIPRIVILDENAVYDHYMRRLNRVWMRRIEASRRPRVGLNSRPLPEPHRSHNQQQASRRKATAEARKRSGSPAFQIQSNLKGCTVPSAGASATSGPGHVRLSHRHLHAPRLGMDLSAHNTRKSRDKDFTATEPRPRSAPTMNRESTAKWAELRDRNHAATGPGPTSYASNSQCCGSRGETRHRRRPSVRPESAPILRGRSRPGVTDPSTHERASVQRVSAWLAPRITRLEMETQELIRACRGKGVVKDSLNDTLHRRQTPRSKSWHRSARHPKQPWSEDTVPTLSSANIGSDERLEDLGRGAVVRLISNLGMGRYAHRFRAFGVTGSDLASCTEQDLVQIGISFRPHRIRLLREIKKWKGERGNEENDDHGQEKPETDYVAVATTTPASTSIAASETTVVGADKRHERRIEPPTPAVPQQRAEPFRHQVSGRHRAYEVDLERWPSELQNNMSPAARSVRNEEISSSILRGVSPLDEVISASPPAEDNTGHRSVYLSEDTKARRERTGEGRAGERKSREPIPNAEGRVLTEGVEGKLYEGPMQEGWAEEDEEMRRGKQTLDRTVPIMFAPSAHVMTTTDVASNLKGTLHVSGVRAADVLISIEGTAPFLRVTTCNQLMAIKPIKEKGAESAWADAMLSFSVTGHDLATGGVLIEFCDEGTGATQDLVASGGLAGETTIQLVRLSCSTVRSRSAEYSRAVGNASDGVTAEIRLFSKPSGGDAGVCTFNLRFRPDDAKTTTFGADKKSKASIARQQATVSAAQSPVSAEKPAVGSPTLGLGGTETPQENVTTECAQPLGLSPPASSSSVADVLLAARLCPGDSKSVEDARSASIQVGASSSIMERRQSSLLLEETTRHTEAIEQVCHLAHTQYRIPDELCGESDRRIQSQEREPPLPTTDDRDNEVSMSTPSEEFAYRVTKRDAAILLQSHTRRRVAAKLARRRGKECKAVVRVQSFARQWMAVNRVRRAREYELEDMRQRDAAAIQLQRTARRRLGNKSTQRLQNTKEHEAAGQIQTFMTSKIRSARLKREHAEATKKERAATTLDNMARTREAKVEVRKRQAWKQTGEVQQKEETAAAAKIQSFSRHKLRAYERRRLVSAAMAAQEKTYRAAVKLQSVARVRGAKARVGKIRVEKKEQHSAVIVQKAARARAAQVRQCEFEAAEVEKQSAAVRRLQVITKRWLAANETRRALQQALADAAGEFAKTGRMYAETAEKGHRTIIDLEDSARKYTVGESVEPLRVSNEQIPTLVPQAGAGDGGADVFRIGRTCDGTNNSDGRGDSTDATGYSDEDEMDGRNSETDSRSSSGMKYSSEGLNVALNEESDGLVAEATNGALGDVPNEGPRKDDLSEKSQDSSSGRSNKDPEKNDGSKPEVDSTTVSDESARLDTRGERTRRTQRHSINQSGVDDSAKRKSLDEGTLDNADVQTTLGVYLEREGQKHRAATKVQRLARARQRAVAARHERSEHSLASIPRSCTHRITHELIRSRKEGEAVKCIQRAIQNRQVRRKVDQLHGQEGDDERRRQETVGNAAFVVQRIVRRHYTHQRAIRVRDAKQMLLTKSCNDAAGCIQRAIRVNQAVKRVAAARAQRDRDVQIALEQKLAKQEAARAEAAEYIQRTVRMRKTIKRDAKQILLSRRRDNAANCIQRTVRFHQAVTCVAVARSQRYLDTQLELEQQLAKQEVTRAEAAECIQRAARTHKAIEQVELARRQRHVDIQTALEQEAAQRMTVRRRDAAECIQRMVRINQSMRRADALRWQRDTEQSLNRELARQSAVRWEAVECIQHAARMRQAIKRVAVLKRKREVDIQHLLESELTEKTAVKREAAECLQRAARTRQALRTVEELRWQRDTQHNFERKLAKQRAARVEAAERIQRAARKTFAVYRVTTLRRQRDHNNQRKLALQLKVEVATWGEGEAMTMHDSNEAAGCIQRAFRKKQAGQPVETLKRKRDIDAALKLELERDAARLNATVLIQCAMRRRQAIHRVGARRHQRKLELELQEAQIVAAHRGSAPIAIQQCHIQRTEGMRQGQHTPGEASTQSGQQTGRKSAEKSVEQNAEHNAEHNVNLNTELDGEQDTVSLLFAKMMEAARQGSTVDEETVAGGSPEMLTSPDLPPSATTTPGDQQLRYTGGVQGLTRGGAPDISVVNGGYNDEEWNENQEDEEETWDENGREEMWEGTAEGAWGVENSDGKAGEVVTAQEARNTQLETYVVSQRIQNSELGETLESSAAALKTNEGLLYAEKGDDPVESWTNLVDAVSNNNHQGEDCKTSETPDAVTGDAVTADAFEPYEKPSPSSLDAGAVRTWSDPRDVLVRNDHEDEASQQDHASGVTTGGAVRTAFALEAVEEPPPLLGSDEATQSRSDPPGEAVVVSYHQDAVGEQKSSSDVFKEDAAAPADMPQAHEEPSSVTHEEGVVRSWSDPPGVITPEYHHHDEAQRQVDKLDGSQAQLAEAADGSTDVHASQAVTSHGGLTDAERPGEKMHKLQGEVETSNNVAPPCTTAVATALDTPQDGHGDDWQSESVSDASSHGSSEVPNAPESEPMPDAGEVHIVKQEKSHGVLAAGIEQTSEGEYMSDVAVEDVVLAGWEVRHDRSTGKAYYYHPATQMTSCERPIVTASPIDDTIANVASAVTTAENGRTIQQHGHPLDTAEPVSGEDHDASAHDTTAAANYSEDQLPLRDGASDIGGPVHNNTMDEPAAVIATGHDDLAPAHDDYFQSVEGGDDTHASEWQEVLDPDTGHKYYYNNITRQSTWGLPQGARALAAAVAAAAVAAEQLSEERDVSSAGVDGVSAGDALSYPGSSYDLEYD